LFRLSEKGKAFNSEVMIAYNRPITVGQRLTNNRTLPDNESSSQQWRYSGPGLHCALCGNSGRRNKSMFRELNAEQSKGRLVLKRQARTCASYGFYVVTCGFCGNQYAGETADKFS